MFVITLSNKNTTCHKSVIRLAQESQSFPSTFVERFLQLNKNKKTLLRMQQSETEILAEQSNMTTIKSSNKSLFKKALQLSKLPIIISFVITPLRFTLELMGINENYIFFIGLLWLTLGFSVYWAIKYYQFDRFLELLILNLLLFSPISRIPVAIAWWVDTNWELGTHYGWYFDNFGQVFLNQIVYGSLVQIIPGFIVGAITYAFVKYRKTKHN